MAQSQSLLITEIFHSLQGEGSSVGKPFAFVRLTGCPLRCTYCDTAYAFQGGRKMAVSDVLGAVSGYPCRDVLITGGEPLAQAGVVALVEALRRGGWQVWIETSGEVPFEGVARLARIVMDIKTPSSGMSRGGFRENLKWLKAGDEVKFVVASQEDYQWVRCVLEEFGFLRNLELLISPAVQAEGQPGEFSGVDARWLAEQVLRDGLPVRLQTQLHKQIWGPEAQGV